ncbi:MAG: cytochrome c oxidase assembly protein [Acidimicrobiia bacterium]
MGIAVTAGATFAEVAPFHVHWDVIGVIVGAAVAYEYGIRRLAPVLAPRGEPAVTRAQRIRFHSGIISLLLVSGWPVHDIGENSLYMIHMVQHLVVSLVAAPLILWGVPWWLLRWVVRPVMPVLRVVTKPWVALLLFNALFGLLHVPSIVELMITNVFAHFVAHAALFWTSIFMWWPVIGPIPDLPKLEPFQSMGYLFLQSLVPTIPSAFLILGERPLFPIYETLPRLWGISAHYDQMFAGLVMKFGGGLVLWGVIAGIFFSWWADEQRYERTAAVPKTPV